MEEGVYTQTQTVQTLNFGTNSHTADLCGFFMVSV